VTEGLIVKAEIVDALAAFMAINADHRYGDLLDNLPCPRDRIFVLGVHWSDSKTEDHWKAQIQIDDMLDLWSRLPREILPEWAQKALDEREASQ
jgi:hypothetical protein